MELLANVKSVLTKNGIGSRCDEDGVSTSISLGLIGGQMRLAETADFLKCTIYTGLFCPDYRRSALAEAVCRCNWRLRSGAFWLDLNDGEVRFQNSIPIRNATVVDEQV